MRAKSADLKILLLISGDSKFRLLCAPKHLHADVNRRFVFVYWSENSFFTLIDTLDHRLFNLLTFSQKIVNGTSDITNEVPFEASTL